jgi:hypothetical protein
VKKSAFVNGTKRCYKKDFFERVSFTFFLARLILFHHPQHGLLLLFQLRLRSRLLRLCRQVQRLRLLDVLLPRVRVRLQPRMRVVQALMLAVFDLEPSQKPGKNHPRFSSDFGTV